MLMRVLYGAILAGVLMPACFSANLEKELCSAIKKGDLERVHELLIIGADPNAAREHGVPCVAVAIQAGQSEIARLLVGAKLERAVADVALCAAAESGMADLAGTLLDQGASPNAKDEHSKTALMFAAESGKVEVARLLLSKGADVNTHSEAITIVRRRSASEPSYLLGTSQEGHTALTVAALLGNAGVVKLLLANRADPNAEVFWKTSFWTKPTSIAEIRPTSFLDRGFLATLTPGMDALLRSMGIGAEGGSHPINTWQVRLSDIDLALAGMPGGRPRRAPALILAAAGGHFDIAKDLLAAGADASLTDELGKRAIDVAKSCEYGDITSLLAGTSLTNSRPVAEVVLYRPKKLGGSAGEPLFACDNTKMAHIDNGRHYRFEMRPGSHKCYFFTYTDLLDLSLAGGRTYYVRVRSTMEKMALDSVPEEVARQELERLRPGDEKHYSSKQCGCGYF